jgi:hypothetical protein
MTEKEKQELQKIKELLKKILDKLENSRLEKTEYHFYYYYPSNESSQYRMHKPGVMTSNNESTSTFYWS